MGLIIFGLILWKFDTDYILTQLLNIRFEALILAIILLVIFHVLKAIRWKYILSLHDIHHSFAKAYLIYVSGLFVGVITPGRLGDFVKIYYLKSEGVSTVKATLCSLVDRTLDIVFLAILGIISMIWLGDLIEINFYVLWGLFVLFTIYFLSKVVDEHCLIKNLFSKVIPHKYLDFLKRTVASLESEFITYQRQEIVNISGLTIIGWLCYFTVIYTLTSAVNLSLPLLYVIALFVLSTLVTFLPVTIAGIGTRDLALVAMFSSLGYLKEDAITFSMIILISYILTAAFGLLAWLINPISLDKLQNNYKTELIES